MVWNRRQNRREMPWKGIRDPYRVWLSEIILQQTRVEQGLSYYNKFIARYPDIKKLAAARDNDVFKLWEGLGYYSRCRNLLITARQIVRERDGRFPDKYEEILKLPGVGPYTAAAISSFVYELPHAVVDGNVIRVLSRYFMISVPFDTTAGKKFFSAHAGKCLDASRPGAYNQAIMDFGATVCKPVPLCSQCPLSKDCLSFKESRQQSFPVKEKKITKKNRWLIYFIVEDQGGIYFRKRSTRDIWQNLHEFILFESDRSNDPEEAAAQLFGKGNFRILRRSDPYSQLLTHRQVNARFIHVQLIRKGKAPEGYRLASHAALKRKAFPRLIAGYITESGLFGKKRQ